MSPSIRNGQIIFSSYNKFQEPQNYTQGDRDPRTGLYISSNIQGDRLQTQKISNALVGSDKPVLIRGDNQQVPSSDSKPSVANQSTTPTFSGSFGGELNKNIWSDREPRDPVDNLPVFYWFGFLQDSNNDRIEITPNSYQHYNAMANNNVFPKSNEGVGIVTASKSIEIIPLNANTVEVRMFFDAPGITGAGAVEIWTKVPGEIRINRKILDINPNGFTGSLIGGIGQQITLSGGNPAPRGGVPTVNGNFYKLPFTIGLPGPIASRPTQSRGFYRAIIQNGTVPAGADIIVPAELPPP